MPGMEAIDLVKAYVEAHNAHDVDRAVSLLAHDIRFETVGVWVKQGRHEVRELEEWDAALGGSLTLTHLAAEGERVHGRAAERNAWFQLAGLDEVYYRSCEFTVREGTIAAIRAQLTPDSQAAIEKALGRIVEWAGIHKGEALARLMPAGQFVYGRESAQLWLTLWQERRASAP